MAHHTKDKGDLAVGMVISDLLINGYHYSPLISEHMPFDLIAINTNNWNLKKIPVKYITKRNNVLTIDFRSTYSDSNGIHVNKVDRTFFDAYAIYCPDIHQIFYILTSEIPEEMGRSITLRLEKPMQNQQKGIRMADNYLGVNRIFS
jgi:hypothetical protein